MKRALCILLFCTLLLLPCMASGEEFRHGVERDGQKRIALTFDDGPHPVYTAEILDLLAEYGIRATFFVIGQNVKSHPALVKREIDEGHEVGNHTLSHPDPGGIGRAELIRQLRDTDAIIYTATQTHPTLFRPPTGLCNSAVRQAAGVMDYDLILWSVDTRDWSKKTAVSRMVREVKDNVKDGSVILFHDYTVREDHATLQALREVIPYLVEQGYTFVTVSEMLEGEI